MENQYDMNIVIIIVNKLSKLKLTGQWDSVRFIGLFGLSVYFSTVYFSMRSLNKPNKPVYFYMHSLTGQWDSVRFIGLFGLSVYFSTVYFSMHSGCLFNYTLP